MEEMNKTGKVAAIECPSVDIAAYIDSELSPESELTLESHLASCSICTDELNLQKQFVNALNFSLKETPDLPEDFTKRIVTNAEADVRGLRRRRERLDAMFVAAGLFLFVLFTLGAKAPSALSATINAFSGFFAVVDVGIHVLYDLAIGVVIILRSVAGQPSFVPVALILFVAITASTLYRLTQTRNVRPKLDQAESGSGY